MSKLQSKARKEYWKTVDPSVRSERARQAALARHRNMTKEEKARMGRDMAEKRWKKVIPLM